MWSLIFDTPRDATSQCAGLFCMLDCPSFSWCVSSLWGLGLFSGDAMVMMIVIFFNVVMMASFAILDEQNRHYRFNDLFY